MGHVPAKVLKCCTLDEDLFWTLSIYGGRQDILDSETKSNGLKDLGLSLFNFSLFLY